jgi:hypothetical protein
VEICAYKNIYDPKSLTEIPRVFVAFTHTKKVHIGSVIYKGQQCFGSEYIVTDPNPFLQRVTDPDPTLRSSGPVSDPTLNTYFFLHSYDF